MSHTISRMVLSLLLLLSTTLYSKLEPSSLDRASLIENAHALYRAGDLSEAARAYRLVAFKTNGELHFDSIGGYALHRMGVCHLYSDSGELEACLVAYRQAIIVRDKIFPNPHNQRAKTRLNLGSTYLREGRTDSAAYLLYAAVDLYENVPEPNHRDWIRSLTQLADVAYRRADVQLALTITEKIDSIYVSSTDHSSTEKALMRYKLASSLYNLDRHKEAHSQGLLALKLSLELEDFERAADCYNLLHITAEAQTNYPQAKKFLEAALNILPPDSDLSRSYLLCNLAAIQQKLNQSQEAFRNAAAAEALLPPNQILHSHIAKVRALLHAKTRDPAQTRHHFNLALHHLEADTTDIDPTAINPDHLDLLALHLNDRAQFLTDQGDYAAALNDYETILQARELLRAGVSSEASRQHLSKNIRPVLDRAIALCYQLYQEQQDEDLLWRALQLSEWARAYGLLRSYRQDHGVSREYELRREVARLEREALRDGHPTEALTEARLRLDRLVQQGNSSDSTELMLDTLNRERLLAHLQQEDADLLLYHLGEAGSYQFQLTAEGRLSVRELAASDSLTQLVGQWREAIVGGAYQRRSLRQPAEQEQWDQQYLEKGLQLKDFLALPEAGRSLIMVPDGALHSLPFAAIPTKRATLPLDYRNLAYFGDQAAHSYAYSVATLLAQCDRAPAKRQLDLLAVAPTFTAGELSPLIYNQSEAETVAGWYRSRKLLTAANATRQSFLALAPTAGIIHLSTHAQANLEQPALSFVAFSQYGNAADNDERLYYNELATFDLPAELLVLSACETSLGQPVPGETTLSLASAFAAAGVRSSVTTLWQVDDRAMEALMGEFYEALHAGHSRREALHTAHLALRNSTNYAHPYYWAAATLHGVTAELEVGRSSMRSYILWGTILFTAAAGVFFWRREALCQ